MVITRGLAGWALLGETTGRLFSSEDEEEPRGPDIGEEDDDDKHNKNNHPLGVNNNNNHHNTELTHSESVPQHLLVEEELEWLSNQDAFPQIEMFDILPMKPNNNVPKNQSPISVLGNSDSIIRIPVQARSKRRRRRRSSFSDFAGRQWWYQYEPKKKSVGVTRMAGMANSSGRRCLHCQSEKTPQWRAGPLGPKTLCNACGVRYKSGRLLPEYRPASSPTFSGDLHSNSHRKVLDMRKQKQKDVMFLPSSEFI
ncbi:hypothetical protein IFM89_028105 [Coptis chinensis]|uniref:GATA-type domain-containing protein n=1 Tax=Coptis chinensis TaxID=261450 RepID=A0A835LXF5_9MAGN|nr:hypothetical protein IFM89_028105 [Coptis chinensis]